MQKELECLLTCKSSSRQSATFIHGFLCREKMNRVRGREMRHAYAEAVNQIQAVCQTVLPNSVAKHPCCFFSVCSRASTVTT